MNERSFGYMPQAEGLKEPINFDPMKKTSLNPMKSNETRRRLTKNSARRNI